MSTEQQTSTSKGLFLHKHQTAHPPLNKTPPSQKNQDNTTPLKVFFTTKRWGESILSQHHDHNKRFNPMWGDPMTNQPISRSLHTFAYLVLLYAVLACSPTPPSTTCTKQTDCSDNLGYRCELGHCVPNTSPNTTNTTTSTNPSQPPLTPSETDTPDGSTNETTRPDGSTTEATLPDSSTTENGSTELQPSEIAQDGGSVESEPTEPPPTEPTLCNDGDMRSCDTKKVGPCANGQQTCQQGAWGDCHDTYKPQPEYLACADNIDNDCDGKTDAEDTKANGCKWDIGLPAASSGGKIRWIATTPVAGALYVLGEYTGTPTLPLKQSRHTFANTTYKRGFLAKLHPAKYFEWIQVFGPNTRDERFRPTALTYHHNATDPTKSSLFLAGHFGNSIIQSFTTQGTSPLITTTKPLAIFVLQYNALGQWTAASKMDTYDGTHEYFSANTVLHGTDALYVAGGIWAKFEYPDPHNANAKDPIHLPAYDRRNPYIIRFSTTNGTLRAENVRFFSPSSDGKSEVFGLAFDPRQQKLFAVGSTAGGLAQQDLQGRVATAGGHDAFLITLNSDLSSPNIRLFGSTGDDFARGIVYDSSYGFFLFGETSSSTSQSLTLNANFRSTTPPTSTPISLNTKGQRTAFLGRWDAAFQAQWIYGAAADNVTLPNPPTSYPNQANATHLALHKNTLYLAGMFRGDLGYYQGGSATPPTILSNKSINPNNIAKIQTMFRSRFADNFLLALDPTTGALQSNTSFRIFDNTGLSTPAGLSFDAYDAGYLFRNEADPGFLQATTNFEIFTAPAPFSPYKAEIVKNLLVP